MLKMNDTIWDMIVENTEADRDFFFIKWYNIYTNYMINRSFKNWLTYN